MHRIKAPKTPPEVVVRALTDESFSKRADVQDDSSGAVPMKAENVGDIEHNGKLIAQGKIIFQESYL